MRGLGPQKSEKNEILAALQLVWGPPKMRKVIFWVTLKLLMASTLNFQKNQKWNVSIQSVGRGEWEGNDGSLILKGPRWGRVYPPPTPSLPDTLPAEPPKNTQKTMF